MFGKTKDSATSNEQRAGIVIDDFFGDEAAVAEAERIDQLHQRMTGVEQQLNSQFTSMAAYAQIAQEQIELVRSESQNANERTEQRVISLVERERNDRLAGDGAPSGAITARLDALEGQVGELRESLQQCLSNQKALADAITDLFTRPGAVTTLAHVPADHAVATEPTPHAQLADNTEPLVVEPTVDEIIEPVAEELVAPTAEAVQPLLVETSDAPLPGTDAFLDDDVFGGDFTAIETHDAAPLVSTEADVEPVDDNAFEAFAAPDIATIEPMASLPAPVLGEGLSAPVDLPVPDLNDDGPIAALSLD